MASFDELARSHTRLEGSALAHLRRLAMTWGPLADFSFADLLLHVPVAGGEGNRFVILGQIRPTTSQTLYREDQVGRVVDEVERPLVARAWRLGQIIDGEISVGTRGDRARIQCIPVRWKGTMLAVLTRESPLAVGRRPGELERVYVEIFDRFARMIVAGDFPFGAEDVEIEEAPRVGDGVMLLDASARVEYASPNAISALHRMGIHSNTEGARLRDLGVDERPVRAAFATGLPITEEVERGPIVVLLRCMPLLEHGKVTGAVLIMRDVSDVRRRDRLLLSKDATIREIHHRVKNNLQTIASLLRLQGRRVEAAEAKVAIEESVRRISSIALVHEALAREPGEEVEFEEVVRPIVRMVEEGLSSPERMVHVNVDGEAGALRAEVATPLALVLTELVQNATEHAFPADGEARPDARVTISLTREGDTLVVRVLDNGVGLPRHFRLEDTASLGLTIVRALVTTELGGTIEMASDDGTCVELRVPAQPAPRFGQ